MHTESNHSVNFGSAVQQSSWQMVTTLALAFWLSASLLLDFLVMPSLYISGMMSSPDFIDAGYSLFGLFNRLELVCAGLSLTGILVLRGNQPALNRKGFLGILLAITLLSIALIYTYFLTPNMGASGVQLDLFNPSLTISAGMLQLQAEYWFLEAVKLALAGGLLSLCCRNRV